MQRLYVFFVVFLVAIIYCRFLMIVVLKGTSPALDLLLYSFLTICFFRRRFSVEQALILFFVIISLFNPAARNLFLIFALIYLLRLFSLSQMAFMNVLFVSSVFIVMSFLLMIGVVKSEMFPQTILDTRERWDYGFGNPNTFALFMYSLLVNIFFLLYKKSKFVLFVFLSIVGYVVYDYTRSRSFLISVILLILGVMSLYSIQFKRIILKLKWVLIPLPLCFLIVSLNSTNELLDLIFSGRLSLYQSFVTSLPQSAYIIGTPLINEDTLDSSYLHLFFEGGILAYCVFYYLLIKGVKHLNSDSVHLIPIWVSFFAYGLTESLFTFVLLFGNMIFWQTLYKVAMSPNLNKRQ